MDRKYIQIVVLASVFGLQFLLEHLFPQQKSLNNWKNERKNIAIGLFNLAVSFLPAGFYVAAIHYFHRQQWGLLHYLVLPPWVGWLLVLLSLDCWMYAWHRLNHRLPLLWRLHIFHHRDMQMNSTTALRFHLLELLLSYPGKAIVCLLMGIAYTQLLAYELLFSAAVIFHHSNIRISQTADRLYRILFASPIMHRIHHSRRYSETHSNYGALFSFWDRLFGTATEKVPHEIVFGPPEEEDKV